jgi:hypothetical protein
MMDLVDFTYPTVHTVSDQPRVAPALRFSIAGVSTLRLDNLVRVEHHRWIQVTISR